MSADRERDVLIEAGRLPLAGRVPHGDSTHLSHAVLDAFLAHPDELLALLAAEIVTRLDDAYHHDVDVLLGANWRLVVRKALGESS